MNNYITTNIILLSKFKLLKFDNYFWKLLLILDFNYPKSKNFKSKYKIFTNINKIKKKYKLNYKVTQIITIQKLELCPLFTNSIIKLPKNIIENESLVLKINTTKISKFNKSNLFRYQLS
jgi:hypothetical protein